MLRLLKDEPKVEISKLSPEMNIVETGICLWKEEHPKFAPQPPDECAVCGSAKFEATNQLTAILNPRFDNGISFGMFVWVHPDCFDDCVETAEPDIIPW